MLDPALLREHPKLLEAGLRRRGLSVDWGELIELDTRRRTLQQRSEELRARQKKLGQDIPHLSGDEKDAAIASASELGEESERLATEAQDVTRRFEALWEGLPNLPHESAADGLTEEDAVELRRWGVVGPHDFEPLDHVELGKRLGMIDLERAARLSGSRFAYLLGPAVLLEIALVHWAVGRLVREGFSPVIPPVLVREKALYGTGFFPRDRDQVYAVEKDDLYLVGTSEVALAGLHLGEILEQLPVRYVGFSTCFRREAGTYGRDMKGIFRVHQFDKVEMFSFTHPDDSWEEHERLLTLEEDLVRELGLPYRVVNIAAGDLGPAASKKYDIEAWIPSQGAYREITSCSNTTDYQARRLRIRFREGSRNRLVHTLNGTAVAIQRTLMAIMENHQQADGSVVVPDVLRAFSGLEVIGP